jgi:hypothetical protein
MLLIHNERKNTYNITKDIGKKFDLLLMNDEELILVKEFLNMVKKTKECYVVLLNKIETFNRMEVST